jgi:hypothetical protein
LAIQNLMKDPGGMGAMPQGAAGQNQLQGMGQMLGMGQAGINQQNQAMGQQAMPAQTMPMPNPYNMPMPGTSPGQ